MAFDKETVEKMGLTWKEGMTDEEVYAGLKAFKEQAGKYDNLKSSFDKTASELAEYKKKEKEGKSETEQLKESNAELSKKIADLEKTAKLRDIKDLYKSQGYDETSANEMAQAQIDGDFKKIGELTTKFMKEHDEQIKKDILKDTNLPDNTDPNAKLPKTYEDLVKLGYEGMNKFSKEHPQEYAQLVASKK